MSLYPHPNPLPQAGEGVAIEEVTRETPFSQVGEEVATEEDVKRENPLPEGEGRVRAAKKIMLIAGEASGDNHGAEVVKVLKQQYPDLQFSGMAGPAMRAVGVQALVRSEEMAVMGFVEVLANFKTIYCAYQIVKHELKRNPPAVIILIDYPGFNLKIAALAKSLGIKVLYYVSPQIWAWKKGRIKKIKACVDMMAVIFPFEVEIYKKAGVPVQYVGSPLAEEVAHCNLTQVQAREKLNLDQTKQTLVLLPGSRHIEIQRIFPVMLEAAAKLKEKYPNLQFVLPVASMLDMSDLTQHLQAHHPQIKLIKGEAYTAIRAADVALCTSGTVTLETALLNTPMILIYKMKSLTYQIIKRLIKIKYIGLCNIVAEKKFIPELIQDEASVENITYHLSELLTDPTKRQAQLKIFAEIQEKLKGESAAKHVAALAIDLISLID